jgi:galactokinase
MGEHTDYNRGLVLPTVIPQRTSVELEPRADAHVTVRSDGFGEAEYVLGEERSGRGWLDYVQGCTATLRAAGHELGGFTARISSDVPIGAGVASSAALEVALLRALREAFDLALDDLGLALAGQRAEVEFVGARVGLMDQLVASLGRERTALYLDIADLTHELVPLPASVEFLVVDSGVAHAHASGEYNKRRAECEEACRRLSVGSLREIDPADLDGRVAALPDPFGRRVRHVVTENERVLRARAALEAADAEVLGTLFDASHASQRDDYEVSAPEVELLARLLNVDAGVYGARLSGGGFGGAVVAVVRSGQAAEVAERTLRSYRRAGQVGRRLVPPP